MPNLTRLRQLGRMGSAVADALIFLTTNWGIAVSIIAALYVARSDWASSFVQDPKVDAAAFAFVVLLWTYIGFTTLIDRQKPRLIRAQQDFDSGLLLEGCIPYYEANNTEATLQLGIRVRNFTDGRLYFRVEQFEMNIGGSKPSHRTAIDSRFIPRGGTRIYKMASFTQSDLKDYQNRKVTAFINLSITYGRRDEQPVRRLITKLELHLDFTQSNSLGYAESTLEESDQSIES